MIRPSRTPGHRPCAEYLVWSAVHGLAMLFIDDPLWHLDHSKTQLTVQQLLDMVEKRNRAIVLS